MCTLNRLCGLAWCKRHLFDVYTFSALMTMWRLAVRSPFARLHIPPSNIKVRGLISTGANSIIVIVIYGSKRKYSSSVSDTLMFCYCDTTTIRPIIPLGIHFVSLDMQGLSV